jgi:hypothetical protein
MYPTTIAAVRVRAEREGAVEAQHVLWMCGEIEQMTDPLTAARWIGWILCKAETWGWWQNDTSRDLVRVDVQQGADGAVNA